MSVIRSDFWIHQVGLRIAAVDRGVRRENTTYLGGRVVDYFR
jgi:hypothetical protein